MLVTTVIANVFVAAVAFGRSAYCNPILSIPPLTPFELEKDPCDKFADRTFRIITTSQTGVFGALSPRYQAMIERNFDTKKKLAGPEVSSCTAKKVGSGCKWGRAEESKLDSYKVKHPKYSPYVAVDTDVEISGDGCDNQTLKCWAEHSVLPVSRQASHSGPRIAKGERANLVVYSTSSLKAHLRILLTPNAPSKGRAANLLLFRNQKLSVLVSQMATLL